jgi:hypothetical protein
MALHEGKVIGCTMHQSTVGVWIVDLSRIAPYSAGVTGKTASKPITRPASEPRFASNGTSRDSSQHSSRASTPADRPPTNIESRAKTPPQDIEGRARTPPRNPSSNGRPSSSPSSPPYIPKAADFYAARPSPAARSSARQPGSIISTPPRGSSAPQDSSRLAAVEDTPPRRELSRTPPPTQDEANTRAERGTAGSSSGPANGAVPSRSEQSAGLGMGGDASTGPSSNEHEAERGPNSRGETPRRHDGVESQDSAHSGGIGRSRRSSRGEKKEITVVILTPPGPNPHRFSESDAAGMPIGAQPTRTGGKRRSGLFRPEDHDIFGATPAAGGSGREANGETPEENGGETRGEVFSGQSRLERSPREKQSRTIALPAQGESLTRGAGLPGATFNTPEPSGERDGVVLCSIDMKASYNCPELIVRTPIDGDTFYASERARTVLSSRVYSF